MWNWIKNMSRSDQIIAAIILGLFGVAAAVIGVVLTQRSTIAHVPLSTPTTVRPASANGSTPPPTPDRSPVVEPAASSPPAGTVVYRGPVEFSGNNGINFDVSPPTSDDFDTVDLDTAPPAIQAGSPNYVAVWPNKGTPTQATCREWVETHPLGNAPVQVGTQVCIRSVGLRTVYLRVTGLDVEAGTISASVIVWSS